MILRVITVLVNIKKFKENIVKNLNSLIGSHIQVSRGFYTHHGIVVDDHKVIHYSGFAEAFNKGCIEVTDLDTFLGDASAFEVVNYPSWEVRYSNSEVVARAYSRLGENDYNLIFNNCEGFACWCITGKNKSDQVDSAMRNATTTVLSYSLARSVASSTINETAKRMVADLRCAGNDARLLSTPTNAELLSQQKKFRTRSLLAHLYKEPRRSCQSVHLSG